MGIVNGWRFIRVYAASFEFAMCDAEPFMPKMPADAVDEPVRSARIADNLRRSRWRAATVVAVGAALAMSFVCVWLYQSAKHQSAESQLQTAAAALGAQPNSDEARREFERVDERPLAVLSRIAIAAGASTPQLVQGASGSRPGRFAD